MILWHKTLIEQLSEEHFPVRSLMSHRGICSSIALMLGTQQGEAFLFSGSNIYMILIFSSYWSGTYKFLPHLYSNWCFGFSCVAAPLCAPPLDFRAILGYAIHSTQESTEAQSFIYLLGFMNPRSHTGQQWLGLLPQHPYSKQVTFLPQGLSSLLYLKSLTLSVPDWSHSEY